MGRIEIASMNNPREKQKNEGKQRNKATGREVKAGLPECTSMFIYINAVLGSCAVQRACPETRHFNIWETPELVRADEQAGEKTGQRL